MRRPSRPPTGAQTCVFETEPPPPDLPLLRLPNVVCTPHLGASTVEAQESVGIEIAEAIRSVLLDGVDIYGPAMPATQTRLRIGMVFQRPNPFPSMTIAQNVLSGLRLSGTKVPNPDALVQECLERAGLWRETRNRLNESGAALSGGQLQRGLADAPLRTA